MICYGYNYRSDHIFLNEDLGHLVGVGGLFSGVGCCTVFDS